MAFPGTILYPAKQSRGEHHEAHGKDIMVDEPCPKKSVSPSERMFANAAYWGNWGQRPFDNSTSAAPYPEFVGQFFQL